MKRRMAGVLIATAFVGVTAGAGILYAHDVLYPGTVLAVETEKLHVKTVDPETKKELTLWFTVTRDTKVRRGDTIVTYADAKIGKDERIVVIVNHDAEVKNVATELRLAATSGVAAGTAAPATSTQTRPADQAFAVYDRVHAALAAHSRQ